MIAVIVGATGLVGGHLLEQLLRDETFQQVITVGRRPTNQVHSKLRELIVPSMEQLSDFKSQLRGDVYFCCLGTTLKKAGSKEAFRKVDYRAIIDFALIAKEFDAKNFVLISAMGADSKSKIFYNQVKGEAENALLALAFKRLVIFRPALLVGDRQEHRALEGLALKTLKLLSAVLPQSLVRKISTRADELAFRMLEEGKSLERPPLIIEASEI